MNFLKQLWPWTRKRWYHVTFLAEMVTHKQDSTDVPCQSVGDLTIITKGFVDACNLRSVADREIRRLLEEKAKPSTTDVKNVTLWIQRVI